jgi:hypothetical protein
MARDLTKRIGYGQVEPNHLSGIVTGQIYAQLPAADDITQLEQGQFAKYDYAAGEVNFSGEGEFMLVYNEEKLYDERYQSHKDFVYKVEDFSDKKLYPRLIKTNIGDIFTTNTFAKGTGPNVVVEQTFPAKNTKLHVGTDGFLVAGDGDAPVFKVVKDNATDHYTMPDGTPGVKIQRIK